MKTYEVINTLYKQDVFDNFEECNIYFLDKTDHNIYYPAYWVYSKGKLEYNSGSLIVLDDFDNNTIINIFKVKPNTQICYSIDRKALIFTRENIDEHN